MRREEGRRRIVISGVDPEVDGGRFFVKRVTGENLVVTADVFGDGHDQVAGELLYRREGGDWQRTPLSFLENDRWRGSFRPNATGRWLYTLEAWIDRFGTWRRDFEKKVNAGLDVSVDLEIGAALVAAAADRAKGKARRRLSEIAARIMGDAPPAERSDLALSDDLAASMDAHPDRSFATRYSKELPLFVDRELATFSAWYEMFPRSAAPVPGRHGTFDDVIQRLPYVAEMGFDILYLPPIHPIGKTNRKGKNNRQEASQGDVGSPWAIGASDGGHKAIHPMLGTDEDFRRLVAAATEHDLKIALDIAFQCSPDHPWAREHPEWFVHRPDGTIQYAENPPKKYEDIYPLNFETEAYEELWEEMKSVVFHWLERGVRIFRVDNPHTKAFPFWEWLIAEVKKADPEAVFLAEAFTRPKVMYRLAKLGFTQSYTYFTWRNTSREFRDYLTELTRTGVAEYFRPNFWTNTPDILPEHLQIGGTAAFLARLVLAATLSSSYGIYGPPFELMESAPREPGAEEYLDSEKYEVRHWDVETRKSLREVIALLNRCRKENPALRRNRTLVFHPVTNGEILCYSKTAEDGDNAVIVAVNLDFEHTHSGWIDLDLDAMGLAADQTFEVHDVLTDARYLWQGRRNYVELDPQVMPAHVFRVLRKLKTEQDFDYFA